MNERDLLGLVGIVPLLPLFGAVVLLFFGRRIGEPRAGWLATGLMGVAFLWSLVMLASLLALPVEARSQVSVVWTWIPADVLRVDMGFLADPLSVTWILLVTGVGTLIHFYAIGYMHGDPNFSRFFAYFNLFAGSMLLLVLANNYLLTFLGWEGVGLCSYLLISFWNQRNAAAVAGKKAFIYNRIGDFGFMLAMFLLISEFGTLDYGITGEAATTASAGIATAIALLLFLGATGKSAQIPLFPWLTDAMEGPTPVSALIHAATMVTAGIFLVARAHPFFEASPDAMTVVAWVGAATALIAGTIAVLQPDLKRVLAYSTISQLGYMFLALGVGGYTAAIFMVIAHAFFKGCLFLGAGSVIHGSADNQDMRIMGGLHRFLPFTAGAMVVATLAITGIPPFAGFWSKDGILEAAFERHEYGLWVVGLLAAVMTGIYMTRLVLLTFFGNERFAGSAEAVPLVSGSSDDDAPAGNPAPDDGAGAALGYDPDLEPTVVFGEPPRASRLHRDDPHESPVLMTLPVLALAGLSLLGGLLNLPLNGLRFLDEWLEPVFEGVYQPHPESFTEALALTGVAFFFAALGITIALVLYRRGLSAPDRDPLGDRLGAVGVLAGRGYRYDEGISTLVAGPGRATAEFLDEKVDTGVVDGAVNGVARLVGIAAEGLRRMQDGLVRRYLVGITLGVVAVLLFLLAYTGR